MSHHVHCVNILSNQRFVSIFSQEGRLPLHYVAEGGHFLLISEFMSARSANINCTDKVLSPQ